MTGLNNVIRLRKMIACLRAVTAKMVETNIDQWISISVVCNQNQSLPPRIRDKMHLVPVKPIVFVNTMCSLTIYIWSKYAKEIWLPKLSFYTVYYTL